MNPYPIKIKFTPAEWRVIEDRLAVADAIADALTDFAEGEEPAVPNSRDEVIDAVHTMLGPEVVLENELDVAVLQDAIDGSTAPYKAREAVDWGNDDEQRSWGRGVLRCLASIERKFEQATGIEARFPRA